MSTLYAQRKAFARWQRDRAIHEAIQIADKMSFELCFERLLNVVCQRSELLSLSHQSDARSLKQILYSLRGLLSVARQHRVWKRTPETWSPDEEGQGHQFHDLLDHLFCTKPVPKFMDQVWFEELGQQSCRHQTIYLHLAGGNSIRGLTLPIPFTKRMAKEFKLVPDHFSVEQAIRWTQLQSLRVGESFRSGVMKSCLGSSFDFEPHSSRVIESLSKGTIQDEETLEAILDHIFLEGNTLQLTPNLDQPQRFCKRFEREVQQLLQQRSERNNRRVLSWSPQTIGGFRHEEAQRHDWSSKYWTIEELTDSQQLKEEGNAQHHCVASYAVRCSKGFSSIWSLRSHGLYSGHRELTIEVRPRAKMIVEALGRCNSRPKPAARRVMETWAKEQDLTVASWV